MATGNGVAVSWGVTGQGVKPYRKADLSNTKTAVKTTPGRLFFINASHTNSVDVYLHFYDAALAGVTVGTDPAYTFLIPASDGSLASGFQLELPVSPIAFETAISIAATTSDLTSPPTSDVLVNLGYK